MSRTKLEALAAMKSKVLIVNDGTALAKRSMFRHLIYRVLTLQIPYVSSNSLRYGDPEFYDEVHRLRVDSVVVFGDPPPLGRISHGNVTWVII